MLSPAQKAAIPAELKALRQWVWFEIHNGRKMPMSALESFKAASVSDPSTWGSWEDVEDLPNPGFCFTKDDPYVFIDMDAPKQKPSEDAEEFQRRVEKTNTLFEKVFEEFDSYSETSVSGDGLHIIGKGIVGPGTHPQVLGIFDRERFCIFTGDIVHGRNEIKDVDQAKLDSLLTTMRRSPVTTGSSLPQSKEDQIVVEAVMKNVRGEAMLSGRQHELQSNKSPSEVDHEFIAMLTKESGNLDQVVRIFQNSPMMRIKCKPEYIARSFTKIRGEIESDRQWNEAFLSSIKQSQNGHTPQVNGNSHEPSVAGITATKAKPEKEERTLKGFPGLMPTKRELDDTGAEMMSGLPPGMIRDLAFHFYWGTRYPLAEVAMLSGIMMFATAAQRAYCGQGNAALNLYVMLLAKSSAGKQPLVEGIPHVLNQLGNAFTRHWVGEQRSEPALAKTLKECNRLTMVKSEASGWMTSMTDGAGQGWQVQVAGALTKLWSLGGSFWTQSRTVNSDDKDLIQVTRPCFSIVAETQPGSFWDQLKSAGTISGFVPRWLILEVHRDSIQDDIRRYSTLQKMPGTMLASLKELFTEMERRDIENTPVQNVELTPEADDIFTEYCNTCRKISLDADDKDPKAALTGKFAENALRLATLLAVSADWKNRECMVEVSHIIWAIRFVEHCGQNTLEKMGSAGGDVSVAARYETVWHQIKKIRGTPAKERVKFKTNYWKNPALRDNLDLIPVPMLRLACLNTKAFKNLSTDGEFERIIKNIVADGEVGYMARAEMLEKYKVGTPCLIYGGH